MHFNRISSISRRWSWQLSTYGKWWLSVRWNLTSDLHIPFHINWIYFTVAAVNTLEIYWLTASLFSCILLRNRIVKIVRPFRCYVMNYKLFHFIFSLQNFLPPIITHELDCNAVSFDRWKRWWSLAWGRWRQKLLGHIQQLHDMNGCSVGLVRWYLHPALYTGLPKSPR